MAQPDGRSKVTPEIFWRQASCFRMNQAGYPVEAVGQAVGVSRSMAEYLIYHGEKWINMPDEDLPDAIRNVRALEREYKWRFPRRGVYIEPDDQVLSAPILRGEA